MRKSEGVAFDGFNIDAYSFGDLVDVVAEFFAQLGNDPGEACSNSVKVIVVSRVAIDPGDPNALKQLVNPRPHSSIVNKADIGEHVGQSLLVLKPLWH